MENPPDQVEPPQLRYIVLLVALMQAAAAVHQAYVAYSGAVVNAILAAVLLAGTIGVLRRVRWGRRIAVAFLWAAIVVSFGTLSPFHAGDLMAEGIDPPALLTLGLQFLAVCVVALVCLHFLGKHKLRFRSAWI